MPITTNSSQNTRHGQHSSARDNSESDDPAGHSSARDNFESDDGSRFYKRKISALEETLNRLEEDRAKKRSVSTFPENQ